MIGIDAFLLPAVPKRAVAAVLAVMALAALCAGAWVWGLQVGGARADTRHARAAADAARAAHEVYAEELRLGNQGAAVLIGRLRDAGDTNARLQKELSHAPRFLAVAQCPAAAPVDQRGLDRDAGDRSDRGLRIVGAAPPPPAGAADPGSAVRLSGAAVRLWNSALAGADVPTGACGADAAPEAACAADSGITFSAAFDNAVDNYARFSECGARLNAWIDLEEARQARAAKP